MPTHKEVSKLRRKIRSELWERVFLEEILPDEHHENMFQALLLNGGVVVVGCTENDGIAFVYNTEAIPESKLVFGPPPESGRLRQVRLKLLQQFTGLITTHMRKSDGDVVTRTVFAFKVKTCDAVFDIIDVLSRNDLE
jgi:hypothetical protein